MSREPGEAPGWHGKLPSLGDFASRRLPHDFVDVWDGWLSAGLAALRGSDGQGWLDGYLASPIWRYLLLPGTLPGAQGRLAWAGVLMPSVDRAGRYFPFTVAWPLPVMPHSADAFTALHRWLRQLDDLAADALQDDWTVQRLESELERLRQPDLTPAAVAPDLSTSQGPVQMVIDSAADVTTLITEDALGIWQTAASGRAFWWCEPGTDAGRLVVTRGLPSGLDIAVLFGSVAEGPGLGRNLQPPSRSAGSG